MGNSPSSRINAGITSLHNNNNKSKPLKLFDADKIIHGIDEELKKEPKVENAEVVLKNQKNLDALLDTVHNILSGDLNNINPRFLLSGPSIEHLTATMALDDIFELLVRACNMLGIRSASDHSAMRGVPTLGTVRAFEVCTQALRSESVMQSTSENLDASGFFQNVFFILTVNLNLLTAPPRAAGGGGVKKSDESMSDENWETLAYAISDVLQKGVRTPKCARVVFEGINSVIINLSDQISVRDDPTTPIQKFVDCLSGTDAIFAFRACIEFVKDDLVSREAFCGVLKQLAWQSKSLLKNMTETDASFLQNLLEVEQNGSAEEEEEDGNTKKPTLLDRDTNRNYCEFRDLLQQTRCLPLIQNFASLVRSCKSSKRDDLKKILFEVHFKTSTQPSSMNFFANCSIVHLLFGAIEILLDDMVGGDSNEESIQHATGIAKFVFEYYNNHLSDNKDLSSVELTASLPHAEALMKILQKYQNSTDSLSAVQRVIVQNVLFAVSFIIRLSDNTHVIQFFCSEPSLDTVLSFTCCDDETFRADAQKAIQALLVKDSNSIMYLNLICNTETRVDLFKKYNSHDVFVKNFLTSHFHLDDGEDSQGPTLATAVEVMRRKGKEARNNQVRDFLSNLHKKE